MKRATNSGIILSEYRRFVAELKDRVLSARLSATRAVNRDVILLYWDIGRAIVEKQETLGWGKSVVEWLAKDLQAAFSGVKGFSSQNLWRMQQFYLAHTSEKFLSQVVREVVAAVPWGHHANVLAQITNSAARIFYLRATARYGLTVTVLTREFKGGDTDFCCWEKHCQS